jgi:carbamoyl-phosphate synthase large subunit
MGIDHSLKMAIYKGLMAAGIEIPKHGNIVATIADRDKSEAIPILKEFYHMGYKLICTEGTAQALASEGLEVERVKKIAEGSPNIVDLIRDGKVDFCINTWNYGGGTFSDGFKIRRAAVGLNIPCLTSLDTVKIIQQVSQERERWNDTQIKSLQEYVR